MRLEPEKTRFASNASTNARYPAGYNQQQMRRQCANEFNGPALLSTKRARLLDDVHRNRSSFVPKAAHRHLSLWFILEVLLRSSSKSFAAFAAMRRASVALKASFSRVDDEHIGNN